MSVVRNITKRGRYKVYELRNLHCLLSRYSDAVRTGRPGFDAQHCTIFLFFCTASRPALEPTQRLIQSPPRKAALLHTSPWFQLCVLFILGWQFAPCSSDWGQMQVAICLPSYKGRPFCRRIFVSRGYVKWCPLIGSVPPKRQRSCSHSSGVKT